MESIWQKPASDRLVLTTEADSGALLLYALRQCFPGIKVEMFSSIRQPRRRGK